MKRSASLSVTASIISTVAVIISIALFNPLSNIMIGEVPMMIYVLIAVSVLVVISGYVVVDKIEKLEDKGE